MLSSWTYQLEWFYCRDLFCLLRAKEFPLQRYF
jgi:hypothetical protein